MTAVVVLGATGELGGRVARLLQRWAPGVQVFGVNRSGRGHADFPVRAADVRDEAALRAALRGATLAVNAVGPYGWDPAPLVRACVAERCHYADLAEAPEFMAALRVEAARAGAAAAGVAFVTGCSTVPGLVELMAAAWSARSDVASIDAYLSLGSRNPASRGLVASLLEPLGRAAPGGSRWFTRVVGESTSDGRKLLFASYPAAFRSDGRAWRFYTGFDRAWLTRALAAAAPLLARVPKPALARSAGALAALAGALRALGTLRGALLVVARDRAGRELARREVHALANGLDIPAAAPVWLVQQLQRGALSAVGAVALADVVPWSDAANWLHGAGYTVVG